MAPLCFMYDSWFRLQTAGDAETKRVCGAMAIYWALMVGAESAKRDFGIEMLNGHEYRVIIEEGEFFGEKQPDYLHWFGGGLPWRDIGLPGYEEFQERFDEWFKDKVRRPPRFNLLKVRPVVD
jgi:hypothetical protein